MDRARGRAARAAGCAGDRIDAGVVPGGQREVVQLRLKLPWPSAVTWPAWAPFSYRRTASPALASPLALSRPWSSRALSPSSGHSSSDVAILPGVFTPTEMLTAWEAGADLLKVFPATALGPQYFKDVLAPLPYLRMVPTGGVSLENCGDFIKAGAVAVAVGSNLVDKKAVKEGRWEQLTATAKKFVDAVQAARG